MEEVFFKLQELQRVLSNKYELESQLQNIPSALEIKEESFNRQKRKFIDLNTEYETNQHEIATLQNQFGHIEHLRLESEQRMDHINTQREYEALDKEINEYSSQEMELRRQIQFLDVKGRELSEQLKVEEDTINLHEAEITEERLNIDALLQEKRNEIAALEDEESQITPDLDPEMLYKFDRILRNKGGRGIVPISQSICSGCFMILPQQFINDVRSSEEVHFCPYCSRILFYDVNAVPEDQENNYQSDIEGLGDLVDESDFGDFD